MGKELEIKKVDPRTLVPHPQNPRVKHAITKIQKSIEEFGFVNPVLVQKGTNRIIAGHGRVQAAIRGGGVRGPHHRTRSRRQEGISTHGR